MTPAPSAADDQTGDVLAADPECLAVVACALARRFAAGATMWCVSPAWPEHARHVGVEFVHPVIVGTRALPAVAIAAPDPVAATRAVAAAGDVVLAVSRSDDAQVADLLRRAPAWGATTVWVVAGQPPAIALANFTICVDDPEGSARFDGTLVLQYHLLWELTHVCFEHPGLLREASDAPDACITCSDEGRLAEVVRQSDDGRDVLVRTAQGIETVDASLVGAVRRDDLLLVHAGVAIATADADYRDDDDTERHD